MKTLNIKQLLIEQRSLIALFLLIAVVSSLNPNFFNIDNFLNIFRQTSINAIIAIGMTFVIFIAGIDLSAGSALALSGAVAASLISKDVSVYIVVPLILCFGAGLGLVNGALVAFGKVQAFMATLIMMLMLRGLTMIYTNGRPITTGFSDNADTFSSIGTGFIWGIPVPVWLMLLLFGIGWYVLSQTRIGRYIYALGGNESATALSGININRVKLFVFAVSGLLAALAGLIVTARLGSAQPTAGSGYELDAIAAVVVGGTSLMGGKGRIFGTLIGALIIGFLSNALNLLNIDSYYQLVAKALVILAAVILDNFLGHKHT